MINAIRAHLAEFGITAPVGRRGVEELLHVVADPKDDRVPELVRSCLAALGSQLLGLRKQILQFRSGRNFSAWIGLVPKQHSSGGRERLGSISKQGDRYLRKL